MYIQGITCFDTTRLYTILFRPLGIISYDRLYNLLYFYYVNTLGLIAFEEITELIEWFVLPFGVRNLVLYLGHLMV